MKKTVFILSSAIILLLSSCCGKSDIDEITVLYWNIQNGMWSDQGNNYDNFVEFVKEQEPDICVWAEAESRYRTDTNIKMESREEVYALAGLLFV